MATEPKLRAPRQPVAATRLLKDFDEPADCESIRP
jgi:hypothetical protein